MSPETEAILRVPRVQSILQLIGLIATSWTVIELDIYLIYTGLILPLPRDAADHVYKHFGTFAAQKQFVRHLAQKALARDDDFHRNLLAEFKETLLAIEQLQPKRNHAVHGVYFFDTLNGPPGLRVSPGGDHSKQTNLYANSDDLDVELRNAWKEIEALSERVNRLRMIFIQELFSPGDKVGTMTPEALASMPPEIRDAIPRHMRERIAPPELRNPNRTG